MHRSFTHIGLGTDADARLWHLGRLAVTGNDSPGAGGSTTTVEDDEESTERETDDTVDEGSEEEDQGGKRRSRDGEDKGTVAFRELQSRFDKSEARNRELADRLGKIESTRTEHTEATDRRSRAHDRALAKAREVTARIAAIPENDPERSVKLYAEIYEPLYDEIPAETEAISRKMSQEEVSRAEWREQQKEQAHQAALKELTNQGLKEEDFPDLQELVTVKNTMDPNWAKTMADEEQIPYLVGELKKKFTRITERQQDVKEQKREHRDTMRGVIGEGQRSRRGTKTEDREEEGPGSMLADLERNKKEKQLLGTRMFKELR